MSSTSTHTRRRIYACPNLCCSGFHREIKVTSALDGVIVGAFDESASKTATDQVVCDCCGAPAYELDCVEASVDGLTVYMPVQEATHVFIRNPATGIMICRDAEYDAQKEGYVFTFNQQDRFVGMKSEPVVVALNAHDNYKTPAWFCPDACGVEFIETDVRAYVRDMTPVKYLTSSAACEEKSSKTVTCAKCGKTAVKKQCMGLRFKHPADHSMQFNLYVPHDAAETGIAIIEDNDDRDVRQAYACETNGGKTLEVTCGDMTIRVANWDAYTIWQEDPERSDV